MSTFRFSVHELALRYHLRKIEAANLMTHQHIGGIAVVSTVASSDKLACMASQAGSKLYISPGSVGTSFSDHCRLGADPANCSSFVVMHAQRHWNCC